MPAIRRKSAKIDAEIRFSIVNDIVGRCWRLINDRNPADAHSSRGRPHWADFGRVVTTPAPGAGFDQSESRVENVNLSDFGVFHACQVLDFTQAESRENRRIHRLVGWAKRSVPTIAVAAWARFALPTLRRFDQVGARVYSAAIARFLSGRPSRCHTSTRASASWSTSASVW